MKKRGVMEQPFVYIFTIVLIGFIVVYGGYMVFKYYKFSGDVEIEKFVSSFKEKVEFTYNLDKGSTLNLDKVYVPTKISAVCFESGATESEINSAVSDPATRAYMLSGSDNFFIVVKSGGEIKDAARQIENIRPNPEVFCASVVANKINLELEKKVEAGKGFVGVSTTT